MNKKKYIDAEKLQDDIDNEDIYTDFESACIFRMIREKINNASVADVEEVRHGKWIDEREDFGTYRCSVCNKHYGNQYNYCPNCGAKMDKE